LIFFRIQIFIFISEVKPGAPSVKLENVVVKTEVKIEVKSEESSPLPSTTIRVHPVTGLPTKEEEYDSSATVRFLSINATLLREVGGSDL
jgi:hypothetical protein